MALLNKEGKELMEEVKKLREENSALRERLERKPWWVRWFRPKVK